MFLDFLKRWQEFKEYDRWRSQITKEVDRLCEIFEKDPEKIALYLSENLSLGIWTMDEMCDRLTYIPDRDLYREVVEILKRSLKNRSDRYLYREIVAILKRDDR